MAELDLTPLRGLLKNYASQGRTALLPVLHAAQAIYGYLPEPVATEIGRALNVPLADVFGVIDFYALFYPEPVGKTLIHVCNDLACAMAGSDALFKLMTRRVSLDLRQCGDAGEITIERAPCLGLCEHAPARRFYLKRLFHAVRQSSTLWTITPPPSQPMPISPLSSPPGGCSSIGTGAR